MDAAARADGIALVISSAYRSDAEQAVLFAAHPDPKWVAPPGKSLHRLGTELDLGPATAYGWLSAHAAAFHFVQRYAWEPWHYGCWLRTMQSGQRRPDLPLWAPRAARELWRDPSLCPAAAPKRSALLAVSSGGDAIASWSRGMRMLELRSVGTVSCCSAVSWASRLNPRGSRCVTRFPLVTEWGRLAGWRCPAEWRGAYARPSVAGSARTSALVHG
jgi:hypothetical protein